MPTPDTHDTVSTTNAAQVVTDPPPNVSSKAAKVLGFQIDPSSGPANKKRPGHYSTRSPKLTQSRPGRTDLEAAHPGKDPNSANPDQGGGRTEEILRRLLSRRRNVVICLIFLFSVVVAVSVVSGFQGKGGESSSTQSKQNPHAPSASSPIVNFSSQDRAHAASPSTDTSVGPSPVGVGGGQSIGSPSSSLEGRVVVSDHTYQGTAPTSTPS